MSFMVTILDDHLVSGPLDQFRQRKGEGIVHQMNLNTDM